MQKISLILSIILILTILCGCGTAVTKTAGTSSTSEQVADKVEEVLNTELFTDENAKTVNLSEQTGTYTINAPGVYMLEGKLEGQLEITVSKETKVKLILNGADIINTNAAAINITSADKVIISTAAGTVNNITSNGTFDDNDKADAAVFSKDDLTLNGEGTLNISSAKHGIVSKNDIKLNGGTVNISSSKKGIEGKDSISIKDGIYVIDSGTVCLESEGDISIEGGVISLTSQKKDGIKTLTNTIISGGKVDILKSSEGIESQTVSITGGEISITSADDGINASTQTSSEEGEVAALKNGPGMRTDIDSNASVTVEGGNLSIVAGGDGIDSNGYINISDGFITISTPSGNNDSAMDYGIEGTISGGTVLACGDGGTAEAFTEQQSQGYILYNFGKKYAAGTKVVLLDSDNNELERIIPDQSFSSVLISDVNIQTGKTFKLAIDEDVFNIEMESNAFLAGVEGAVTQMGMGPGGNGQGNQPQMNGQQPPNISQEGPQQGNPPVKP